MGNRQRRNKKQKREEIITKQDKQQPQESSFEEDYCFVCKDGGLLIVCDHKECVKAYHPNCVGKEEESTEEAEDEWICAWHNCLLCKRSSKYQCFCCPNAVCQQCFKDAEFARTSGNKGFCNNCLKLAMLGEEGLEYDSDGEKVDFKDRETYEGLFKEYWDIIKEKEGLTLEDLHNADVQIKKGENSRSRSRKKGENVRPQSKKSGSDSDEYNNNREEDNKESSDDDLDSDDDHDVDDQGPKEPIVVKTKKRPKRVQQKPKGSKRIEFVGWASKSLIEFLTSLGVDTSKKQSQDDVASFINKYAQERKLFHHVKKKLLLCDDRLQSVLGRKSFSIYKIHDVLEPHFLENLEKSEDEGYSSGYEENDSSLSSKKEAWWRKAGSFQSKGSQTGSFQHKGSLLEKFQQKEAILEEPIKKESVVKVQYSLFATIIPKNMKLIYLRRSLVEELLGQYETFESKVVGSFVKVKCDPVDCNRPYQLLPVTGVTRTSDDDDKRKVLLQVSTQLNAVPISLLSNDDLSEEDCGDLRQKAEHGLLEKPTVEELEKKVKSLHEDITKHWITRELSILRRRIDLANEKGRRGELYEFRRKRDLLQSEEEQLRMLKEIPQVIADVIEITEDSQHSDTPEKKVSSLENL